MWLILMCVWVNAVESTTIRKWLRDRQQTVMRFEKLFPPTPCGWKAVINLMRYFLGGFAWNVAWNDHWFERSSPELAESSRTIECPPSKCAYEWVGNNKSPGVLQKDIISHASGANGVNVVDESHFGKREANKEKRKKAKCDATMERWKQRWEISTRIDVQSNYFAYYAQPLWYWTFNKVPKVRYSISECFQS